MHHHSTSGSGVPLWLAIVVPLVTAFLGLLGGGFVRFLLDRRQTMTRAAGFARVVREELLNVAQRLDPDLGLLLLLPTQAWEQHSTELAGALLPQEFSALTVAYRAISSLNWQMQMLVAPIPGAAPREGVQIPSELAEESHIVTTSGLPMIEWLALGKLPFWWQRRAQETMMPDYAHRCRCGHRWDCHRWTWHGARVKSRDVV